MYELRPVYPNELYHHGIKNQQWGVQNGPPYPLDRATHRAVVKSDYKNARRELRNTAYHVLKTEKAANKANKGGAFVTNKTVDTARRTDLNRTSDFYKQQYQKALSNYKQAAKAAGKNADKYNDSKKSLNKQAFLAGKPGLAAFGTRATFGLIGALAANKANNNYLRDWARQKETSAKFDRYKTQRDEMNKISKNGKLSQKEALKEKKRILLDRKSEYNKTNKLNYERTKRLSKIDEDIKNAQDSRERQFLRAYRSAVKSMSNEQFSKFNSGRMKQRDLADLIENYDPY